MNCPGTNQVLDGTLPRGESAREAPTCNTSNPRVRKPRAETERPRPEGVGQSPGLAPKSGVVESRGAGESRTWPSSTTTRVSEDISRIGDKVRSLPRALSV